MYTYDGLSKNSLVHPSSTLYIIIMNFESTNVCKTSSAPSFSHPYRCPASQPACTSDHIIMASHLQNQHDDDDDHHHVHIT